VTLAKLSPNLHKSGPNLSKYEDPKKIPEDLKNISVEEYEKNKMEKLLAVAAKWERDD